MKKFKTNEEVSEKLREFVKLRFTARGKFNDLETASDIPASRWKNFYYGNQEATQEIIKFWVENYADDHLYSSGEPEYSDEFQIDKNVSEILRNLIASTFKSRGRFSELEMKSGISSFSWKSFFYRRQEATQEMVGFWCSFKPESSALLLRQEMRPLPSAPLSLNDRLNWVIRVYGPGGADYLFEYLSKRISDGRIPAEDWEKLFQNNVEPTLEMVVAICKWLPNFTEWIICGSVTGSQSNPQLTREEKEALAKRKAELFSSKNENSND